MNISKIMASMLTTIRELNPNIPQHEFDRIWGRVKERVQNEPPPTIALIGESGVGKSSTLNALFNAGQPVSHTEACTQEEFAIRLEGENGAIIVYDMPGLSESISSQSRHLATYEKILSKCDVALWIFDAQNRAISTIQSVLANEISTISPDIVRRMVFAVNKVDLVHPGTEHWIKSANLPSEEQERNIKARMYDIQLKMKEAVPLWTGQIVGYSAQKRYNLPQLFAAMLDGVSVKRQWILTKRKSLANYFEFVDPRLLPENKRALSRNPDVSPEHQRIANRLHELSEEERRNLVLDKKAFAEWLAQESSQTK